MQTVLIVAMSDIRRDVRVLRHIAALKDDFEIVTIGYGSPAPNVRKHLRIPDGTPYLPLNLTAILPHLVSRYAISSKNTKAIRYATALISQLEFDVAILNDVQTLPLMDVINQPVLIDMHEYAPREMEDDWRFRIFLMNYYNWLCSRYLPRAAAITTVSRSLVDEFSRQFGVEVELIYNARAFVDIPIRKTEGSVIRLVHVGLAARARRLDVLIEAVSNVKNVVLDMYLVSAPRQHKTLTRLKRQAKKTQNVRVLDPVPSDELPYLINRYDLSLVFFSDQNFSVRHSMPNKLFDSIQARVGVVSGPSPDIREFCRTHGIGESTETFSSSSLKFLLNDLSIEKISRYKQACDQLAQVFNAKVEGQKIRSLLLELLDS